MFCLISTFVHTVAVQVNSRFVNIWVLSIYFSRCSFTNNKSSFVIFLDYIHCWFDKHIHREHASWRYPTHTSQWFCEAPPLCVRFFASVAYSHSFPQRFISDIFFELQLELGCKFSYRYLLSSRIVVSQIPYRIFSVFQCLHLLHSPRECGVCRAFDNFTSLPSSTTSPLPRKDYQRPALLWSEFTMCWVLGNIGTSV